MLSYNTLPLFSRIARATGLALVLAGTSTMAVAGSVDKHQAQNIINDWNETSRNVAVTMMQKYGAPNEATDSMLIWHDNGPWRRTIVYKEAVDHHFPMPHKDVLEQFIAYKVEPKHFDELAAYDGSVIVERTKGEISARCDKEAANFLALNLANEIVEGNMSVKQARQAYAENIKQFMQGDKPDIMQGLAFSVNTSYDGYTDKTVMKKQH